MPRKLDQLMEILDAQMSCYRDMRSVLAKERNAATRSDKDELIDIGQAKQAIVQTLKDLENRRRAVIDRLAGQYGVRERPFTVSGLCARLEEPYASRLKTSAGELKVQIETVKKENETNARLFSQALDLVHGSLKLLNDLIYSQAIYTKPGGDHRTHGYAGGRGKVFCGSV